MFMKNKIVAILIFSMIVTSAGLLSAYSVERSMGSPVEIEGEEEGLRVVPEDPEEEHLFDLDGFYPGKTKSVDLTVSNEGVEDLEIDVLLGLDDQNILTDALTIEIYDDEDDYFSGSLRDLKGGSIDSPLVISTEEEEKELTFALTLEEGYGDATQGKSLSMNWTFTTDVEEPPGEEVVDPEAPEAEPDPDPALDPDPDPAVPLADVDAPDFPDPAPDVPELAADLDPDIPLVVPDLPPEMLIVDPEAPDILPDTPADEVVVEPEAPQVAPVEEDVARGFPYWLLLLLLIPLLLFFLLSCQVVILVPKENGGYKVVNRRIARWKDKKWHANLEKQLDKHLARSGFVAIDFRGWLLRKPMKVLYAGRSVIGTSNLRYAVIGRRRIATWVEELKENASRPAG